MFVDIVEVSLRAGDGGDGAVSFRREKYVPAGGPDGGDGGKGGDVVFRVDPGSNTLVAFKYKRKFVAERGENGKAAKCHGRNGTDAVITVPAGTVIRDPESGKIIHDMSSDDCADFIVCRGGRGGWGNRHFATSTRQAPRFSKSGMKGEEKTVLLELKMLADVGLIGYPSVGKSSILSRVSDARPKIAAYHFTTLSPNLGVVSFDDQRFVAADIPGLIEDASEGAGLGLEFLRHIDRCRLLIHVVDISASEGRDPIKDIEDINRELIKYDERLAERPQIIAANKFDLVSIIDEDSGEAVPIDGDFKEFESYVRENGWEGPVYISAYTGYGLDKLVRKTAEMLSDLPPIEVYRSEIEDSDSDSKENPRKTTVLRENDRFVVEGEWLYNLLGQVNMDDYESLAFFGKAIENAGVIQMLREKGAKDGDTVSIYGFEFDFVD